MGRAATVRSQRGGRLPTGHIGDAVSWPSECFNGTDPYPTLSYFETLVKDGKVHYFIASGFGGGGSSSSTSAIASWVENNYTSTTVDGITVYDLSRQAGG